MQNYNSKSKNKRNKPLYFFLITILLQHVSCVYGVERIVSLAPSNTEIILKLGRADKLIGITKQCPLPEGVLVEYVGEFAAINKEKVFALKPDLVLTSDGVQEQAAEQLKNLGLQVKIISAHTIDRILDSILNIGSWIGAEQEAFLLVRSMKMEIDMIDRIVKKIPLSERPAVFLEMWNTPLSSAGNESFIHEIITRAGGISITAEINERYPRINPEYVVLKNPDIIIIGYQFSGYSGNWKKEIRSRPGWQQIKAVRTGEIYDDVPPEYFLQPGPHVSDGIAKFHAIIMNVLKKNHTTSIP